MTKKMAYEFGIAILAIISVIIAIVDVMQGLNEVLLVVDYSILFIFVIDYFTRLVMAENKKKFVKENILDLIALIPFSAAFRIFRVAEFARVLRILRIVKILRLLVFLARAFKKSRGFFDTNGFKYVLLLTTVSIIAGGVLIHYVENMSLPDGVWWAFVTATTVGYGDISPATPVGRLIAMVLMLLGIGLIGSLTSTITSYFLHVNTKRSLTRKSFEHEFIDLIKKKLDHPRELSDQDIEDIKVMLKALQNHDPSEAKEIVEQLDSV